MPLFGDHFQNRSIHEHITTRYEALFLESIFGLHGEPGSLRGMDESVDRSVHVVDGRWTGST